MGLGHWRSMFFCILIFPRLFVDVFPFPPSKVKLIGDVVMNRQHAAFLLFVYPCVNILKQRCTFPQQAMRAEFAAFII